MATNALRRQTGVDPPASIPIARLLSLPLLVVPARGPHGARVCEIAPRRRKCGPLGE